MVTPRVVEPTRGATLQSLTVHRINRAYSAP